MDEVGDDREIDREAPGFQGARMMNKLVQFEGDQQGRCDHREVLGPELVEPEPGPLDQLECPIAEREKRRDPQLGGVQVVQIADDPVEQRPPRIEVDGAEYVLGYSSEIPVHVEEEVNAGREQQHATNDPFRGDQAKDAAAAGSIVSFRHSESSLVLG